MFGRRSSGWGFFRGNRSVVRSGGRFFRGRSRHFGFGAFAPSRRVYSARSYATYISTPFIEYGAAAIAVPAAYPAIQYDTYVPAGVPVSRACGAWPDGQSLARRAWQPWEQDVRQKAMRPPEGDARTAGSETAGRTPTEQARRVGVALGRGDKAFERGDYAEARGEYVRAVILSDSSAAARISLGISEFALGNFDDAAWAIREGVARAPHLGLASLDLREAYEHPEDLASHLAALEAVVESDPNDADAWFLLGFVRYFSGDRSGGATAFATYRSMPEADPRMTPLIEHAGRSAP